MPKSEGRIQGREPTPGCLLLTFDVPCTRESDRLHHLLCALEEWRKSNPGRRIDELSIIREQSRVNGLTVKHSSFSDAPVLRFDLIEPVIKKYGMEYMEALMNDATGHYLSCRETHPVVVMLSRRQIAIVVFQSKSRGYILDMEIFLTTLDTDKTKFVKEKFEAWKSGDEQGYLVYPLPTDFRPFFVEEE